MKIAIIGGGAAGFFAAISAKENYPASQVIIYEKTKQLLAKVKVSGGGRCNVTNGTTSIRELSEAYPRGGKELKKALQVFNTKHTFEWFKSRGVDLKVEQDGRAFPISNSSQTIIDCFLQEAEKLGIEIVLESGIKSISPDLELSFPRSQPVKFDKVIVASGGSPNKAGLEWLSHLGHTIVDPVPSLFTFNMPKNPITKLMGVVATEALVSIQGTKLRSKGPVLITHWGMSGPAVLKLSSFGARSLHALNYDFNAQVNWVNRPNNDEVLAALTTLTTDHPNKELSNARAFEIPQRLWDYLLSKSGMSLKKKWGECGKKSLHKLTAVLTNDVYAVKGKTTFKEEFVTSGGVSLSSIDFSTMQSKVVEGLYFAGEVMDIDGITGGFNFQSAWTTGFIAGKLK
jgi:predicted Rossmann fold flavoprotein